jgi:group I intron endonuclease
MGTIYIITSDLEEKVYIGQTTWKLNKRWSSHKKNAKMIKQLQKDPNNAELARKCRTINNCALYKAMAKYGIEQFKITVLEVVEKLGDLNAREKHYIEKHNCVHPNGYNMTTGGGSKYAHSEETKNIIKQTKRANIDKIRHPMLAGMPLYFTYEAKREAFLLQKHELCRFATFSKFKYGTVEAAKQAAIAFVQELEERGVMHEVKRIEGSEDLPKNMHREKCGTVIATKQIKGVRHRMRFSDGTEEERIAQAQAYLDSLGTADGRKKDINHKHKAKNRVRTQSND